MAVKPGRRVAVGPGGGCGVAGRKEPVPRLRLFYGLLTLASEMDTEVKPSSKGRSRTMTAGKPHSYRRRRTERTASEDPRTTAWDMHRTLRLFLYASPVRSITVATVMLRALDRVRGRALGLLGSGSPKSQPHQALRGVAKLTTGWALTSGIW